MKRVQEIDDVIGILKEIKTVPLHYGYRSLLDHNANRAIEKLERLKTLLNTSSFWE